MCSKDVHRENKKIATRSVCGEVMSYMPSVTMHVWTLRSPHFVARWNEDGAIFLFCQPTGTKLRETSEPFCLSERENAMSASSPTPQQHHVVDKNQKD
jgi:hypothetical protein